MQCYALSQCVVQTIRLECVLALIGFFCLCLYLTRQTMSYKQENNRGTFGFHFFSSLYLLCCVFFCDSSVSCHLDIYIYPCIRTVILSFFFLLPILHSNDTATCKISILKQLNESHVNNTGFDSRIINVIVVDRSLESFVFFLLVLKSAYEPEGIIEKPSLLCFIGNETLNRYIGHFD